jgi:hypothetical protein
MTIFRGRCHCGRVAATFETDAATDALTLRACQCSFCRRHGAKTVADPNGHLVIEANGDVLRSYRFGLATADFLLCAECGVYIAAAVRDGEKRRATLNVAGLAVPELATRAETPVSYESEDAPARLARRWSVWTPTEIVQSRPASSRA